MSLQFQFCPYCGQSYKETKKALTEPNWALFPTVVESVSWHESARRHMGWLLSATSPLVTASLYFPQVEDLIKTAKSLGEKAEQTQVLEGWKKSKYVLLKNESDVSEEQKVKLIQVKNVSPTLKRMHELKEKIRQIFAQTQHWLAGLFQWGGWLKEAKNYFPDSQKTIIRWLYEIIAYFDNRTTSGVVEGINNKLKLIKRSAYGFRHFENYRIRCLLNWHFIC